MKDIKNKNLEIEYIEECTNDRNSSVWFQGIVAKGTYQGHGFEIIVKSSKRNIKIFNFLEEEQITNQTLEKGESLIDLFEEYGLETTDKAFAYYHSRLYGYDWKTIEIDFYNVFTLIIEGEEKVLKEPLFEINECLKLLFNTFEQCEDKIG